VNLDDEYYFAPRPEGDGYDVRLKDER